MLNHRRITIVRCYMIIAILSFHMNIEVFSPINEYSYIFKGERTILLIIQQCYKARILTYLVKNYGQSPHRIKLNLSEPLAQDSFESGVSNLFLLKPKK